jgi:hypothetical protein
MNTTLEILACLFVVGIGLWVIIPIIRSYRKVPQRHWMVYWYEPKEFGHIEHGQLLISANTEEETREVFSKQFPYSKISGVMEVK